MGRTDGKKQEETVRIRLSTELLSRCRAMQGPSGWGSEAESSFLRHLIDIGVRQKEFEDRKKRILEEAQIDEAVKQVRQEEDFEKQEMLNRIKKIFIERRVEKMILKKRPNRTRRRNR